MRPLTPTARTALLFYVVFAGIVILLNYWPKAALETSALPVALNSPARAGKETGVVKRIAEVDLTNLQKAGEESWNKFLTGAAKKYGVKVEFRRQKLETQTIGGKTVKWIYTESALVLPEADNEEKTIRLGTEWIESVRALGYTVDEIKEGYGGRRLWFTLSGCAGAGLVKINAKLPYRKITLTRLTLIQPLKKTKGINLWGLIPRLRPEFRLETQNEPSPPEAKSPSPAETPTPGIKKHPVAAIIIDDVGFIRRPADEMLKIAAPLTWSVLPFTPYAGIYIDEARKCGFEIMLHLPLEAIRIDENPGPGLIKRNWSEPEIVRQLNEDLQNVPGAVGVNNHMGSAGTQDSYLMDVLMKTLKQKKLFFVDSYTDPRSVAEKYAAIHGVPFAKRKVFIDNETDLASQKKALHELIQFALENGEAIGIAHAREGSAEAIQEMLPEFTGAGVEIVPVSKLVR